MRASVRPLNAQIHAIHDIEARIARLKVTQTLYIAASASAAAADELYTALLELFELAVFEEDHPTFIAQYDSERREALAVRDHARAELAKLADVSRQIRNEYATLGNAHREYSRLAAEFLHLHAQEERELQLRVERAEARPLSHSPFAGLQTIIVSQQSAIAK